MSNPWCSLMLGVGVMLSFAGAGEAQTISLLEESLSFQLVEEGPVQLDLDVEVTSTVDLDSIVFSIVSDPPGTFVYREPLFTNGNLFLEDELETGNLPEPGQAVDADAVFTYATVFDTFGFVDFPATLVTLHLESAADLEPGIYTLSFDTAVTQWGQNFALAPFIERNPFTLTVTDDGMPDDSDSDGEDPEGDGADEGNDDDFVGPPVPDDGSDEGSEDGGSGGEDGADDGNDSGGGGSPTDEPPAAPPLCGASSGQATLMGAMAFFAMSWMTSHRRRTGGRQVISMRRISFFGVTLRRTSNRASR